MFSKTLIKLIDFSIFPAILLVTAKILGVLFLSSYFGVDYEVSNFKLLIDNHDQFILVNSYSSLFMFLAVISGLSWVVFKAHVFHDTHISPIISSKLFSMNLEDLIHTTETIFSQSFIWISYAWLCTIIFGLHATFGISYWWVFYVALGVSVVASAILILDVEREINVDVVDVQNSKSPGQRIIKFEELVEDLLK